MAFHNISSEAVTLAVDVQAKNSGWKVQRDDVQAGAYWKLQDHNATPPNKTLYLSFIAILLIFYLSFIDLFVHIYEHLNFF